MKSSFHPHRAWWFSAQDKPAINTKHLPGSVIPGKIPSHPRPPFCAHPLQYCPPRDHSFGERHNERFNALIDPPATAFTLQAVPWCALGRDNRCSSRQRFRNCHPEVLIERREYEKLRLAIGRGLGMARDRA